MAKYQKSWESIDSRPIPEWFDKAKLGIFVHWGIYSVPAYAPKRRDVASTGQAYSEWYGWQIGRQSPSYYDFHSAVYGKDYSYADFAPQWKAELFDPDKWANLFAKAGAKYLVLVSKHHDAFCLWPSAYSKNWNTVEVGPHRDIVGELLDAAERRGIKRGLYYSLLEWYHPLLEKEQDVPKYAQEKMIPQLQELVENYRPSILFTDGEWTNTSDKWCSMDFITWLYNTSCVKDEIVINDRWGKDTRGLHGGYLTCEYGEVNSKTVDEADAQKNLAKRKWEECRGIGHSFGFNRNEELEDYLQERQLIELLVDTVSRGGNLCLNVGPCADGTIPTIMEERLLQLGQWLEVNGEAIYETTAGTDLALPEGVRATRKADALYLFFSRFPKGEIRIPHIGQYSAVKVELLGSNVEIHGKMDAQTLVFQAPVLGVDEAPCRCVYTFRVTDRNR